MDLPNLFFFVVIYLICAHLRGASLVARLSGITWTDQQVTSHTPERVATGCEPFTLLREAHQVTGHTLERETTGYEPFTLHAPKHWAMQGYVVKNRGRSHLRPIASPQSHSISTLLDGHFWTCSVINLNLAVQMCTYDYNCGFKEVRIL